MVDFRRKPLAPPRVMFEIGRGWNIERGLTRFTTTDQKEATMEALVFRRHIEGKAPFVFAVKSEVIASLHAALRDVFTKWEAGGINTSSKECARIELRDLLKNDGSGAYKLDHLKGFSFSSTLYKLDGEAELQVRGVTLIVRKRLRKLDRTQSITLPIELLPAAYTALQLLDR